MDNDSGDDETDELRLRRVRKRMIRIRSNRNDFDLFPKGS